MPRPILLTSPLSKDSCVFCVTRVQFASHRPQRTLHRRFFRSTAVARKPSTDAAPHKDREPDKGNGSGWRQNPSPDQSRGSWTTNTALRDLTPEEQDLRNALTSNYQQPRIQKVKDPLSGSITRKIATDFRSEESGKRDFVHLTPDSLQQSFKVRRHGGNQVENGDYLFQTGDRGSKSWDCRICQFKNDPGAQRCFKCDSSRPQPRIHKGEESERMVGWKHVRRRVSPELEQEGQTIQPNAPTGDASPPQANAAEQDSTARMERAKDGKFVGFAPRGDIYQKPPFYTRWSEGWGQWNHPSDLSKEALDNRENPVETSAVDQASSKSGKPFDEFPVKAELNAEREPRSETRGYDRGVPSKYVNQSRHKERKSRKFVSEIDNNDEDDHDEYMKKKAERKKQRERAKSPQKVVAPPTPIYLPEFISISNLAGVLRVRVEDFLYKMKELGFETTTNDHVLDAETAGLIAAEFNFEPIVEGSQGEDLTALPAPKNKSNLPPRPPIVTIMGHVDHGKTTMLDFLRKSSIAASEHGGITQHIGAFSVPMSSGRLVTFLDTPGHEAFLNMRKRGANVTDIVILVVAADDSVKPQTVEAIKHAQAAKVPMIVAVNKIDKEGSNVERVEQDLARYGVEIENYGGDTQIVCVSGKTGQGMEELEDAAVALADILDMRAAIDGQVEGWVLEGTTKSSGRVATVLVKRGTLRPGDVIVAGTSWARVRSLRNEAGVMVDSAGPGIPVEIDGWREQATAGDEMIQAPDEQKAKAVVEYRLENSDRRKLATDMEAVNETRRLEQEKRDQLKQAAELAGANPEGPQDSSTTPTSQEVFFVVKADVSGSVEAVTDSISALGNSEIRPHILRSGVGPITEFDLDHAAAANGHIVNFNTTTDGHIHRSAESKGVEIIDQSIIYRLVDDVKAKLAEKLPPIITQRVLGEAEISQIFQINIRSRIMVPVAGCKIRNGVISRIAKIRVLRDKETIYDGTLSSLKNVKKDVSEMRKGNECGLSFDNWTDFNVGDQIQAYEELVEKRKL